MWFLDNMTSGGLDGNTGFMMVTTQNASRTIGKGQNFLIREVEVLDSSRVTVQGLVDLLTSRGLARYRFNAEDMRCRW